MTPAEALAILRASRDGQPAHIEHDNGVTLTQLAHLSGVMVTYVRVDLTQREWELRTVEATEKDVF